MAKKKKEKKSISILNEVDKTINGTYENLREEIEEMQLQLHIAEEEAKKRAKKAAKRKKGRKAKDFYDADDVRKKVRREMVEKIEGNNFLDRAMAFLKDISPIFVTIARLIASLILCILSIDIVKVNIKPETLDKMTKVYEKAMSVC